jgi:pimeloyl-ACP methyl ester carboxylesterase
MATAHIILIPGLGTSPRTYAGILPALWKHGTVTIANHTQDDSMAAMATRILAAAPPQFALIGHSMGGYIAFEIMRQAPQRVLKLALLNTSARPDTNEAKERRTTQIGKARAGGFPDIIAGALPAFLHPSHAADEALRQTITAAHHDAGAEAYIRQQTAIMTREDSRPDLGNITIPTLVLTGDADQLIPLEPSQEIAAAITGATLVVIPESGHMAALEQPQAVSKALDEWLA